MDSALDRVRDRAKASSLSSARPNPSILDELLRPAAPAEPLPPGPERLPVTGPGSGVRLQSRLQAWLSEEAPDRHLREAQLTARADGLWRVEERHRTVQAELEGKARRAQQQKAVASSETARLQIEREALYKKRHDLDMREQQILRTQGVADTDEALAQRTLQRVLAEKREQDELFDMWRTEVKEARDELHEQIRTSIRKDLAEARENQLHQEIQFQSNAVRRLHEETLKQQHELDTVRDTLQRRHQAAIENYKFSFEIVQEELAECVKERDEYAQELQVHKEANEELKCEVEALEDELESFGRFQAIEAEQQQRLRTLLATSDRDRLVTFFDIWKRYTHGEWEAENPEWQRQMPSPLHFLRQLRKQLPKRNVNPEEQAPGVLGWVDGAERAALGWQRCLLIRVLICWSSVVQEKMLPPKLLRVLRPWMPWRNCRPDPEGMTWMQADGRMRRQVERTCLREVMKQWHAFVSSLLPPLQLLFWLRPYIPGRGLAHGEQEEVLSWEQLEKRLRDQSLRYCLLSAFDGWLSWMSAERGPDSVMWVIDTSRWPKARSQFERTWNSAERSQRRAERARQRAVRLREEEEERQRALRQRSEEVAAVAHSRREIASQSEEARRRSTLRPYEFPQVLRSDVELSPRRSPRVASPE